MVVALGSVQPVFALPLLEDIPDNDEDSPVEGVPLVCSLALTPLPSADAWIGRNRSFGTARDRPRSSDILQLLQ